MHGGSRRSSRQLSDYNWGCVCLVEHLRLGSEYEIRGFTIGRLHLRGERSVQTRGCTVALVFWAGEPQVGDNHCSPAHPHGLLAGLPGQTLGGNLLFHVVV